MRIIKLPKSERPLWQSDLYREYVLSATWEDSEDVSFAVEHNGQYVAEVFLIREGNEFTCQGGACPEPNYADIKYIKYITNEIAELAVKRNIKRVHIKRAIPGYINHIGYTCIHWHRYEKCKQGYNLTKGHMSAISKAKKYLTYDVSDDIGSFMLDYFYICGKVTRPPESFSIIKKMIECGMAKLYRALFDGKVAGYTLIMQDDKFAYYAMSATFEQYKEYNVGHFLQDAIMHDLPPFYIYELGEQVQNSLYNIPSEKEYNISKFKRGFGGDIVTYNHSEYFFDREYMQDTLEKRIQNYIDMA